MVLLMVVPSPRIARRAIEPSHVDLDLADENIEIESLDLLPPYSADLFATEEPDAFVAENLDNGLPNESDPIVVEEESEVELDAMDDLEAESDAEAGYAVAGDLDSTAAEEFVSESEDDHDMSAVAGVSVLSETQVADLAIEHDEIVNRLDPNAEWTIPVSVFRELEPLNWDCEAGEWARELTEAVGRAVSDLVTNSAEAKQSVNRLSVLGPRWRRHGQADGRDGGI